MAISLLVSLSCSFPLFSLIRFCYRCLFTPVYFKLAKLKTTELFSSSLCPQTRIALQYVFASSLSNQQIHFRSPLTFVALKGPHPSTCCQICRPLPYNSCCLKCCPRGLHMRGAAPFLYMLCIPSIIHESEYNTGPTKEMDANCDTRNGVHTVTLVVTPSNSANISHTTSAEFQLRCRPSLKTQMWAVS